MHFSWHLVETIFSFVQIEKFLEELHSLQKVFLKTSYELMIIPLWAGRKGLGWMSPSESGGC